MSPHLFVSAAVYPLHVRIWWEDRAGSWRVGNDGWWSDVPNLVNQPRRKRPGVLVTRGEYPGPRHDSRGHDPEDSAEIRRRGKQDGVSAGEIYTEEANAIYKPLANRSRRRDGSPFHLIGTPAHDRHPPICRLSNGWDQRRRMASPTPLQADPPGEDEP